MITLCLTNYNRTDLLFDSFRQVINDDRISEIVIVDDHSTMECFNTVFWYTKDIPKVKLYRNDRNLDCYRNKREAVSKATNDWVILFDSDNILTKEYVDKICSHVWDPKELVNPSFAKPHFDFTKYSGLVVDKTNVFLHMHESSFTTMLNAMNYFVNRDEYLKVWDGSVDPVTSDSIFHNYNWLKAGNSIYVMHGLEYEHRVHDGSHYRNNVRRTPIKFHESIEQKLRDLR
jgi:glycosyltransferase involved in cell wall biosynthesis